MAEIGFQQYRRVSVGALTALADGTHTDLDMDIEVRSRKEGNDFTVGIWNLGEDTWEQIKKQQEIEIELGWVDGPTDIVCLGRIERTYFRRHNSGADTRYILEGVDATKARFGQRHSRTWEGPVDPTTIAADIAGMVGAEVAQAVPTGAQIPRAKAIKDDQPARYWVDQMVSEASDRTGQQWEWDAHDGQFFFRPKSDSAPGDVTLLSGDQEGDLQSIERATGQSTQDSPIETNFTSYMVPSVRKGISATVSHPVFAGEYKIVSYQFRSDTVDGTHNVSGTLVPDNSPYTAVYPGVSTGGARYAYSWSADQTTE